MAKGIKHRIELGLTKPDGDRTVSAVLDLETDKGFRGGVQSTARVMWTGDRFESCILFGDFSKRVAENRTVKATQKAIDTQHANAFTADVVAALTAEAKAYYAGKAEVVTA